MSADGTRLAEIEAVRRSWDATSPSYVDLGPTFLLCHITGEMALNGECPEHGGDACLYVYGKVLLLDPARNPALAELAAARSEIETRDERLDKATTALRMIEGNDHGESWSAGVAMSALASLAEVGYPKPCSAPGFEGDPYTMGLRLCDDDGIVRSGRFHNGTDYPCTGHAHFAGQHIECKSPAHALAASEGTRTGERP